LVTIIFSFARFTVYEVEALDCELKTPRCVSEGRLCRPELDAEKFVVNRC